MITKLLLFLIVVSIGIPYADAVPLSDKTGLKFTFPVKTDGHSFIVEVTAIWISQILILIRRKNQ